MRPVVPIVVLALALAGCATVRRSLGEYQKAADKGVTFNGPPADAAPAPASRKPAKAELPTGLGGDKAHADYTGPQA